MKLACTWPSTNAIEIDLPVRIVDHASHYRRRHVEMTCGADMTQPAFAIARQIRGMLGDACITRPLPTPVDCEVWDERADGSITALPDCSKQSSNCYSFAQDATCGGGLRVEIVRALLPPMDTMVSVRCKL